MKNLKKKIPNVLRKFYLNKDLQYFHSIPWCIFPSYFTEQKNTDNSVFLTGSENVV